MKPKLPKIKIVEYVYYSATRNEIMVCAVVESTMKKIGISAVSFERPPHNAVSLLTREEMDKMLEHTGWVQVGVI